MRAVSEQQHPRAAALHLTLRAPTLGKTKTTRPCCAHHMVGAGWWSWLVAASPLELPRWTHLKTTTDSDTLTRKKALPLAWGVLRSLILLGAATATSGESCVGGPCGPAHQICDVHDVHRPDPAPPQPGPGFHLMHESCGENDPNGVVLDPVHGVLHYFMQLHVVTPAASGAPDAHGLASYGHFASRDAVHWARLPVAIWNGVEVRSNGSTVPRVDRAAVCFAFCPDTAVRSSLQSCRGYSVRSLHVLPVVLDSNTC